MSDALPVTVDINVLVGAVTGGHDSFSSWPAPPPGRGNVDANALGVLNDGREFGLVLTHHILVNLVRILAGAPPRGYGWSAERAEAYTTILVEMAEAARGGVIEPRVAVADCPDHEANRILECALASGSVLIVTDDSDLLHLAPWRGIPIVTSQDCVGRVDAMRRARRCSRG